MTYVHEIVEMPENIRLAWFRPLPVATDLAKHIARNFPWANLDGSLHCALEGLRGECVLLDDCGTTLVRIELIEFN